MSRKLHGIAGMIFIHNNFYRGEIMKKIQTTESLQNEKLTDSRKTKLILFKILETAEIGGMEVEHCGMIQEAVSNCLDEICVEEEDEATLSNLNKEIQEILDSEEWIH